MTYDHAACGTGEEAIPAGDPVGPDVTVDMRDARKDEALAAAARQHLERLSRDAGIGADRYKVSRYDIPVALADGSALLFNSRSRSLVVLSSDEAASYRVLTAGGPFAANDVPDRLFLQVLAGGGHFVGATVDELAEVRRDYETVRAASHSLTLTIAPTMACNLACGYCFQGLNKPSTKMSTEVENAIVTFVKARSDLKSLHVVWYGGEPLMGKESIFRLSDILIAHCDKHGIAYSAGMVSNSYLLSVDVATQLYSRRVKWVQVTIDGDRDTHDTMRPLVSGRGSFDRIINNIGATLDATPLSFSVRVNVGRRNVDELGGLLDGFVEKKFNQRGSFNVYFAAIEASTPESGSAFEEKLDGAEFNRKILALEEKARNMGLAGTISPPGGFSGMCVAASNGGYVIGGNGDVHKCWETVHDATKRIGTIFEPDKLGDSINATAWQQWSPFDNATCSSCGILPMCGGHCAHRFIYGGPDQQALPCPSWKWNTAEYVFSRAKDLGVTTADQWLAREATVTAKQSGERHSAQTLQGSQRRVLEKISARHARVVNRDMLLAGEPALGPKD